MLTSVFSLNQLQTEKEIFCAISRKFLCLPWNSTTGISLHLWRDTQSLGGCCCPGEEDGEHRCCRQQPGLSFPAVRQHCPAGTECRNEREMLLPVLREILQPPFLGRNGSSLAVLILLLSGRPESCFFQRGRLGAGSSCLPRGILLSCPLFWQEGHGDA